MPRRFIGKLKFHVFYTFANMKPNCMLHTLFALPLRERLSTLFG
jgi:hypothetical protein